MKPYIFASSMETARALVLHLVKQMLDEPHKTFCIAFSGGSTLALMFDLWANEYANITPWERLKVFWVDECCVPPEDSDSNYGMMRSLLLDVVPIPYENIFRIQGEREPKKEAARYSKLVMKEVPTENGFPAFDVVLLGVDDDGHTSCIFPGQEKLLSTYQIYDANSNPNNGQKRIALTGIPILNARKVVFFITGKKKSPVVEDIFYSGDIGSAAYIAHHAHRAELFMDHAAAGKIVCR